ncbi:MAG TPA: alpha/beta fold hydrolase [Steroidobacteraceae bacterium]
MSVIELLADLRALDVHVELEGDRLRLNARAGALTDAHREQLQRRKAEIVEFLRTAQQLTQQQRSIVPLQPGGTRTPVFAVAGHNGDVFCYRALAGHLGADQPFFGLQPPGLEEGSEPLTEVEALAAYFADQIRQFQPSGPCVIAGFCAGGTVAFELARQLSQTGRKVASLVLFGAPFCTSYRKLPQLIANSSYLARRSVVHAKTLLTMPASERRRYLAERARVLQPTETVAPTDPVMARRSRVEEATMVAVRKYQPDSFNGHLDLMLPCESWKQSSDAPLRWGKISASCAQFVGPDDCNGDTMLLPQHAATFAALFEQAREQYSRGRDHDDLAYGH